MTSPRTLPDNVTVEYDCRNVRKRKTFASAFDARKFWTAKHKDGKRPQIISDRASLPVMSLRELTEAQKTWKPYQWQRWEERVEEIEQYEDSTRSDAQGACDIECLRNNCEPPKSMAEAIRETWDEIAYDYLTVCLGHTARARDVRTAAVEHCDDKRIWNLMPGRRDALLAKVFPSKEVYCI